MMIVIRPFLTNFCSQKLKRSIFAKIWFQQDGATCNTGEATLDILRSAFEDRSCDLTPVDFYLCGAIKDKCYADKPETIGQYS